MNCYVKVYGCQMNSADFYLISRLLAQSGIHQVEDTSSADSVVLLTCSVRQHAEDRAAGFARTMRGEGKKVVLAGCMAQLRGAELIEAGIADFAVGPDQYRTIPSLLSGTEPESGNSDDGLETYADLLPQGASQVSASIAVMRGCDNYCTYCVVPYARGRERSLPYSEIVSQIKHLLDNGTKEIFLLGQNVLAYNHQDSDFIDVLEGVSGLDGLRRLGFLTSHPRDLELEDIKRMADIPQLLSFFHLPMQSGSDRILDLMGRGYNYSDYARKINWIREYFPDVYLTTDLLVGFPGETDQDYQATLAAVRDIGFDFAYMFAYSSRPGTRAASMSEQVPEDVRQSRLASLIDLQGAQTKERAAQLVGSTTEVFVTASAPRGEGAMIGELKNHRSVIINREFQPGEHVQARLVGLSGRSLLAEPATKEAV